MNRRKISNSRRAGFRSRRALSDGRPLNLNYDYSLDGQFDSDDIGRERRGRIFGDEDEHYMEDNFTNQENRELRYRQQEGELGGRPIPGPRMSRPGVQATLRQRRLARERAAAEYPVDMFVYDERREASEGRASRIREARRARLESRIASSERMTRRAAAERAERSERRASRLAAIDAERNARFARVERDEFRARLESHTASSERMARRAAAERAERSERRASRLAAIDAERNARYAREERAERRARLESRTNRRLAAERREASEERPSRIAAIRAERKARLAAAERREQRLAQARSERRARMAAERPSRRGSLAESDLVPLEKLGRRHTSRRVAEEDDTDDLWMYI